MGTIDRSRYVVPTDQELENFVCMVCLDVFVNPVVTQCCRQLFCYKCITDWLRKDNTCPKDRKPLDLKSLTPAPKLVTQFLDKLKVTCDYREEGCPLSLSLDKLNAHTRVCEFRPGSSAGMINTFKTFVECHPCLSVNTLSPRNDFQILFEIPFDRERPPEPKPVVGLITTWDAFHVKMSNSIENRDHIRWLRENESETPNFFNCTWHLIEETLNNEITCYEDFEKMVKSYNGKFRDNDFNVIYKLFQDNEFQSNILESLNWIRQLALKLPYFFSEAIPHLREGQNCTLMLSRQQIACLLANGFFCTFPRRTFSNSEYKNFSTFNFAR